MGDGGAGYAGMKSDTAAEPGDTADNTVAERRPGMEGIRQGYTGGGMNRGAVVPEDTIGCGRETPPL